MCSLDLQARIPIISPAAFLAGIVRLLSCVEMLVACARKSSFSPTKTECKGFLAHLKLGEKSYFANLDLVTLTVPLSMWLLA
jgi:hypothetical protein